MDDHEPGVTGNRDRWARSPRSVLLVTDSIEPSGLGVHMITLAGALPLWLARTLLFPGTAPGLCSARCAREAGLASDTLPLAALRLGSASFCAMLEHLRPDIVHVHAGIPEEGHQLAAAARACGVPAVVRTEHQPYTLRTLKVRTARIHALEAEYANGVQHVNRIICVCDAARKTFRMAHVSVPFSVVRNGISAIAGRASRTVVRAGLEIGEQPLVLTVARFVRQKRHITLVNALPRLLAACPAAVLAWVGQGPLEAELRARARELGVLEHILFLGNRCDVPDLMAAADVLCLPSYYEGHPLVILEALAAGLPVVAARVLGVTEAVRDGKTGMLFPVDDAQVLAGKLATLLLDASLRERLRNAGLLAARRQFSARRMAQETLAVYRQALAGGGGSLLRLA